MHQIFSLLIQRSLPLNEVKNMWQGERYIAWSEVISNHPKNIFILTYFIDKIRKVLVILPHLSDYNLTELQSC